MASNSGSVSPAAVFDFQALASLGSARKAGLTSSLGPGIGLAAGRAGEKRSEKRFPADVDGWEAGWDGAAGPGLASGLAGAVLAIVTGAGRAGAAEAVFFATGAIPTAPVAPAALTGMALEVGGADLAVADVLTEAAGALAGAFLLAGAAGLIDFFTAVLVGAVAFRPAAAAVDGELFAGDLLTGDSSH